MSLFCLTKRPELKRFRSQKQLSFKFLVKYRHYRRMNEMSVFSPEEAAGFKWKRLNKGKEDDFEFKVWCRIFCRFCRLLQIQVEICWSRDDVQFSSLLFFHRWFSFCYGKRASLQYLHFRRRLSVTQKDRDAHFLFAYKRALGLLTSQLWSSSWHVLLLLWQKVKK